MKEKKKMKYEEIIKCQYCTTLKIQNIKMSNNKMTICVVCVSWKFKKFKITKCQTGNIRK